jgi:hypothetical protein
LAHCVSVLHFQKVQQSIKPDPSNFPAFQVIWPGCDVVVLVRVMSHAVPTLFC